MSSARPEGSMEVKKIYWFTHPNKLGVASSSKIHNLLQVDIRTDIQKATKYEDYIIKIDEERYNSYEGLGLNWMK